MSQTRRVLFLVVVHNRIPLRMPCIFSLTPASQSTYVKLDVHSCLDPIGQAPSPLLPATMVSRARFPSRILTAIYPSMLIFHNCGVPLFALELVAEKERQTLARIVPRIGLVPQPSQTQAAFHREPHAPVHKQGTDLRPDSPPCILSQDAQTPLSGKVFRGETVPAAVAGVQPRLRVGCRGGILKVGRRRRGFSRGKRRIDKDGKVEGVLVREILASLRMRNLQDPLVFARLL